jgi:hypothetical protein
MFLFAGSLTSTAIWLVVTRRSAWARLVALVVGLLGIWLLVPLGTRGNESWLRNAILYLTILAGMMLRTIWDSVDDYVRKKKRQRRKPKRPEFDVWEFLFPSIASLLVFQVFLGNFEKQDLSLQLCLSGFQNGFFWNAIFRRVHGIEEGKNEASLDRSSRSIP